MWIRIALFSFFICSMTNAQDKKADLDNTSAILRGSDYAFAISIPQGWTLDSAGAIRDGRDIFIYTSKGTIKWHSVITFAAATKAVEGKNTLNNLLAWVAKVDSAASVPITNAPSMTTTDKRTVIVKRWVRHNQVKTHGCVGYIDDEQFVAVITLMADSKEDFNYYLPAFNQVIESYSSVSAEKKNLK